MAESTSRNVLPPIVFSEWFPWTERASVPGSDLPGVYLIGRFDSKPPPAGSANPLDKDVLYIGQAGESYERTLQKRWSDFERTATTGKWGHSGGRTYRSKGFPKPPDDLYIAALQFPYPPEDDVAATLPSLGLGGLNAKSARNVLVSHRYRQWFRQVEAKLRKDFRTKHGQLPPCNKV